MTFLIEPNGKRIQGYDYVEVRVLLKAFFVKSTLCSHDWRK